MVNNVVQHHVCAYMMANFPTRAFVQVFDGRPSPEGELVVAELQSHGIPVVTRTTEDIRAHPMPLQKTDLVVGDFEWTRTALKQLGVTMPEPPDYPECLQHLLHRKIWRSTLGEVQTFLRSSSESTKVFIKPASDTKAFSGLVASASKDDVWLEYLLEQFPHAFDVWCSEIVSFVSEYRVYVVDGEVRSICQYQGPKEVQLDDGVVKEAVRTLMDSDEGRDLVGCGIDFAVMRKQGDGEAADVTCLLEVNDGVSLGAYDGLSGKDYTDMLIARWARLVKG